MLQFLRNYIFLGCQFLKFRLKILKLQLPYLQNINKTMVLSYQNINDELVIIKIPNWNFSCYRIRIRISNAAVLRESGRKLIEL